MKRRVSLYGGSFSPFGNHHLDVLSHVADTGEFNEIIVVPSIAHALKATTFPYEHRINMATLAMAYAKLPVRVTVSMVELYMLQNQPGPILTIQLLRYLRKCSPQNTEAAFRFVIGPDIIEELDQWKGVDDIRREFGFLEIPEQGIHAAEIRDLIAQGSPTWKRHIPPPVAEYIEMHQLYCVDRVTCDHEWESTLVQTAECPHKERCGKCNLPKPGSEVTP